MKRAYAGANVPFSKSFQKIDPQTKPIRISGRLETLYFPQAEEFYVDFFIGIISGYKVKGKLPFLDWYFTYNLLCKVEASEYDGRAEYKIVGYHEPACVPVPLDFVVFKNLLKKFAHLSDADADTRVHQVKLKTVSLIKNPDNIDVRALFQAFDPVPPWLTDLSKRSMLFKYPYLKQLSYYWDHNSLSRLTIPQLVEVALRLEEDIVPFCFKSQTLYDLPELNWSAIQTYTRITRKHVDDTLFPALVLYKNITKQIEKTGQVSLNPQIIHGEWNMGGSVLNLFRRNVIKTIAVPLGPGQKKVSRIFLTPTLILLQRVASCLNRLLDSPVDFFKPKKRPVSFLEEFNAGQRDVFGRLHHMNFLIVTGPPGTGKTWLIKKILEEFGKTKVMLLSYFATVAAMLKLKCTKGMTVHKMHVEVLYKRLNTENIEVLALDEASTATWELVDMMLSACPNVKKLFIFGDENQMKPPTPGPILDELLAFYQGTPVVCRLTEIMRIKGQTPAALLHKEILMKFSQGDCNVPFSTSLASDAPFVILPRAEPRLDDSGRVSKKTEVKALEESLKPIVNYYPHSSTFQIITQKNIVVGDCNEILFNLLNHGKNVKYSKNNFRVGEKVMLVQTNYETYEPTPEMRNDPDYKIAEDKDYQLRTDVVSNGDLDIISQIYDMSPVTLEKIPLQSTSDGKPQVDWQRIVLFKSGNQVNLTSYSMGNLRKGEVCTIAKTQGLEYEVVVAYIHAGFSKYLSKRQLITAVGRGSKRFVIICKLPEEGKGLEGSEIQQILETIEEPLEPVLYGFLKPFQLAIYLNPANGE